SPVRLASRDASPETHAQPNHFRRRSILIAPHRSEEAMASTRRQFLTAGTAAAATLATRAHGQWQPSQRYPDPSIKIVDPSFAKYRVNSAKVERLATGFRWCEGPGWFGGGRYLLWGDIH